MESQEQFIIGNDNGHLPLHATVADEGAFGYPRDFLNNKYVYVVISPRANGLSIGVNLNPVMQCTFNCLYCEVDRSQPANDTTLDIDRLAFELAETIKGVETGQLRQLPRYGKLSAELLQLRHVALSGDGEPTLSNKFVEVIQAVAGVRSVGKFFKIVLVTNSTGLDRPQVCEGLKFFVSEDEVWAKLDGGTDAYVKKLNGATISLEKVLSNILLTGRKRPIVIQSLFPAINGEPPPNEEIEAYIGRLKELKNAGAKISLVQIYSATRPMAKIGCSHLPLKKLSQIAKKVQRAGIQAQVF